MISILIFLYQAQGKQLKLLPNNNDKKKKTQTTNPARNPSPHLICSLQKFLGKLN